MMDPRDRIILEHAPLIASPRFSKTMPDMQEGSHRFVAAEDGIYLEVLRPWLHLIWPVATTEIPLPYGSYSPHSEYVFNKAELSAFIARFITDARNAMPNEAAACVIWNDRECRLHYQLLSPMATSPFGIQYQRPVLDDHESLAIDLHSHGDAPAFWSTTDDQDDTGEVKVAVVVGEVNDNMPAVRIRLCALGLFIDLESPL